MIIIGVDPGTIVTGYGIIKFQNHELSYLSSGVIVLSNLKDLVDRLKKIYDELDVLIKKNKPDAFASETAFYGKNVQSAMKIGYARGVAMLAAAHNDLIAGEYSPREIKKATVGNGAASKEQVQYMIKRLLGLGHKKTKYDETDALAVAVCHAFRINSSSKQNGNWKNFVDNNPQMIID